MPGGCPAREAGRHRGERASKKGLNGLGRRKAWRGGAEEGLRWPGPRRGLKLGDREGGGSQVRGVSAWQSGSESRDKLPGQGPGRVAASAVGAGMKARAGPGQGSLPPAGSPRVPGVSAGAGVSFCTPGGLPGPDGGSAGSVGARRGGGPGVLAARAPHRALLGHHLVQPPGDPRNLLLLAHHCLRGSAPSARRASSASRPRRGPRPSPPPAPAAADAALQRAGDPPFKPPAPRPPRCILGHVVPARPPGARAPRPGPHLPGACGGARLLGNGSPDAGGRGRPTRPDDSQPRKPSRSRRAGRGRCGGAWG